MTQTAEEGAASTGSALQAAPAPPAGTAQDPSAGATSESWSAQRVSNIPVSQLIQILPDGSHVLAQPAPNLQPIPLQQALQAESTTPDPHGKFKCVYMPTMVPMLWTPRTPQHYKPGGNKMNKGKGSKPSMIAQPPGGSSSTGGRNKNNYGAAGGFSGKGGGKNKGSKSGQSPARRGGPGYSELTLGDFIQVKKKPRKNSSATEADDGEQHEETRNAPDEQEVEDDSEPLAEEKSSSKYCPPTRNVPSPAKAGNKSSEVDDGSATNANSTADESGGAGNNSSDPAQDQEVPPPPPLQDPPPPEEEEGAPGGFAEGVPIFDPSTGTCYYMVDTSAWIPLPVVQNRAPAPGGGPTGPFRAVVMPTAIGGQPMPQMHQPAMMHPGVVSMIPMAYNAQGVNYMGGPIAYKGMMMNKGTIPKGKGKMMNRFAYGKGGGRGKGQWGWSKKDRSHKVKAKNIRKSIVAPPLGDEDSESDDHEDDTTPSEAGDGAAGSHDPEEFDHGLSPTNPRVVNPESVVSKRWQEVQKWKEKPSYSCFLRIQKHYQDSAAGVVPDDAPPIPVTPRHDDMQHSKRKWKYIMEGWRRARLRYVHFFETSAQTDLPDDLQNDLNELNVKESLGKDDVAEVEVC
ncbi:unnamed protein product [Amoebophrya sp. A120]|nr:unnamed protein product [Amoebophrya sp. A120]|eukprot:GSA120T00005690001.1